MHHRRTPVLAGCLLFALILGVSSAATPVRLYVNQAVSQSGDGSSWATAKKTINEAIAQAGSLDSVEIWVAEGTYAESITFTEGLRLYGSLRAGATTLADRDFTNDASVIDGSTVNAGAPAAHVVIMENVKTVRLDGFAIQGGDAEEDNDQQTDGGGIYALDLRHGSGIYNCRITNNNAFRGGGIHLEECDTTIADCEFSANSSDEGGAVASIDSLVRIQECTFSKNTADSHGGGAWFQGCEVHVNDCAFQENDAYHAGGAYLFQSQGKITTSSFVKNRAHGVSNNSYYWGGTFHVRTDTVSVGIGGGAWAKESSFTILGTTFTDNSSSRAGGGLSSSDSALTVKNCSFNENGTGGSSLSVLDGYLYLSSGNLGAGGGIHTSNGEVLISQCTLSKNYSAVAGGGISLNGAAQVINCEISDNDTHSTDFYSEVEYGEGGGVSVTKSSKFVNCTIARNEAHYASDGVYREDNNSSFVNCIFEGHETAIDDEGSSPSLKNCLFFNNTVADIHTAAGANLTGAAAIMSTIPGATGILSTDPTFADPANGNYHLLMGSAAIDAGANAKLTLDRDGNMRPFDIPGLGADHTGTEYDIGAYEFLVDVITRPALGAIYHGGDPLVVEWNEQLFPGATIAIYLDRADQQILTLTKSNANDGRFTYTLPAQLLPAETYRVRVMSVANPLIYAFSENFFIERKAGVGARAWTAYK